MHLKSVPQLDCLQKKSSKSAARERTLLYVLLLSGSKGEAVSWALNVFGPEDGFHILRKFSKLTIVFPSDVPTVRPYLTERQLQKLTVSTDSPTTLRFPAFDDIAAVAEKVRCYMLYAQLKNKRIVAQTMGWKESEVWHVYKTTKKKIKALRGVL